MKNTEIKIANEIANTIIEKVIDLGQKRQEFDLASILYRVRNSVNCILVDQENKWSNEL